MALDAVTEALKNLARDDPTTKEQELDYFCVEDCFLSKDINVSVEGVGKVNFPINETFIQKLNQISSKAVFGRGEKTVLDTNVRDTQTIPASKLKVNIKERSLAAVLERIGIGLNIDNNCVLVPHLYNMLIYGPGQFFNRHRDSEKIPKMVATLVIVLPSPHKGGDLIIEHNDKRHSFFGSHTTEIVKCIAFYSDCRHEIKKVTEGYRIALTFNVVLNSPKISQTTKLDECLKQAISNYFKSEDRPRRLIFYMNHSYSKCSLKWGLLKGSDKTRAHALYFVGRHLGLKRCLALVDHQETYEIRPPHCDDELFETSTEPYFWISWHDQEFVPPSGFRGDFRESEICYTIETSELLEPYRTDKDEEEPYGNSPETEDRWYKRACVVLLRIKKQSLKKPQNHREERLPNHLNKEGPSKSADPGQISNEKCDKGKSCKKINDAASKEVISNQTKEQLLAENNHHKANKTIIFENQLGPDHDTKPENMTILPSAFYSRTH